MLINDVALCDERVKTSNLEVGCAHASCVAGEQGRVFLCGLLIRSDSEFLTEDSFVLSSALCLKGGCIRHGSIRFGTC